MKTLGRFVCPWQNRLALPAGLLCALVAGASATTNSPAPYAARLWQMEDGLPHTIVQAITQTRDGYLWVGTREGLARFDGVTFHSLTAKDFGTGLMQPSVTCLCEAPNRSLWIGTENVGLFRLQDGKLAHLTRADGLRDNMIYGLAATSDGSLWVAAGGLGQLRDGKLQYPFEKEVKRDVSSLFLDSDGVLWIVGTDVKQLKAGKVTSYTPAKGRLPGTLKCLVSDWNGTLWGGGGGGAAGLCCVRAGVAARYTKGAGIAGIVGAVLPDQEGNTWVGTYAGLCRFADGQFVAEGGYLGASYRVFCLFQDREHNVWVGSEEGLVRLTPRHFTTYTMQEGLTQDAIASVCAGRDGSVWIAVWGGGVNHFVDGHFAVIGRSNGLSSDFVLALDAARDGSLWVGADYGFGLNHIQGGQITHYGRAEGLTDPVLTALLEDEAGNMWIGSRSALNCLRGGTFNRYTMRQGLSNNKINALCVGQRGVVWIGTEDGLTQWTNGQFIVVSATEPLLRKTILSLYEDPEGTLWVGTRGAGVVRLRAGKADSFTTRDGLLSDSIYAILEDDRKNLWFNSSKGIFCVRKTELQEFARDGVSSLACVAYGKMDGIASSGQYQEVAQPAACKARDGRLWFRTTHGVAVVDPNITVNKLPPLVAIEQVLADRQDVALDKSQAAGRIGQLARPAPLVTIPPGRGDLEIHYTALSLRAPERNLFKYKLDRVDSAWVDAGGRRVAYYNNLAHGEYRFRVIACNNDGVWNEAGAAMVLILQPHYWQTWWFLGLCSLTAAAALAGSVRYATRRKLQRKLKWLEQQHAVETERMRIARDLHDNLGTRLTEILMLNEVSGSLSNNQEPTLKPSSRRISSLVRELVENLDAIVWSVNPKNDSLDNFVLYVYEYIDRVANVSPVPILRDIPATLPDCPLSSEQRHNLFLVIKEALNNVFRHSGATEVWFRLRVEDSTLALSLEDNGNGFAPGTASELGNGLVNMEKRMELIGGTFVVSSAPGAGTRIQLQVPLSNLAESKVRNPGSETHAA